LRARTVSARADLAQTGGIDPVAALDARTGGLDPVAALDVYHAEHLPGAIDGRWLPGEDAEPRAAHAALLELLGDLASPTARPMNAWPAPIRAFLASTYSDPIDPAVEEQRVVAESLESISDALAEVESLPGALGREPCPAAAAIELVLSICRGSSVSPRQIAQGEPAIELLGWLDLPMDPASVLVVTGFQEGFVPAARRDDPFLPDGLRRRLALPCSDDRIARDVYAATVLLESKREIAFVSGRANGRGDPLLPSRLAFHAPGGGILERVERLRKKESPRRGRATGSEQPFRLPRLSQSIELASMSVTSFADFLRSPYFFYLRHVLGLETLDDRAREMDPRSSGSLAHAVLEEFGRGELRDSTDEREIASWLRRRVESLGQRRFGASPRPAVRLQLAQLALRFEHFARAQSRRAAEGWRIHEIEWKPRTEVQLELGPGERPMPLHGKIDRIDAREKPHSTRLEWAILDYKTGASAKDPEKAHRNRSGWKDLQLPLYTLLARELAEEAARKLDGAPALGYFTVGKDESETRVALARWTQADLESALEAARDVVRRVRRGEFFDLGRNLPEEPILLAIAGRGLVTPAEEEDGAENGEVSDGEEAAR
jgi:RecB family exonuclease